MFSANNRRIAQRRLGLERRGQLRWDPIPWYRRIGKDRRYFYEYELRFDI